MAIKSTGDKMTDASIKDTLNILRLSETEKIKAERLLVSLRKKIVSEIAKADPTGTTRTEFQKQRLEKLYREVDKVIDANFKELDASTKKALQEMGKYETKATIAMVDDAVGVGVMGPYLNVPKIKSVVNQSMIDGKIMKSWWKKQAKEFKDKFKQTIDGIMKDFQLGMLSGHALGQMISSVAAQGALMGYTRRNVEAMIRTSFMQVANDVRQATFQENADVIKGIRWVSVLDNRTTPICRALDGSEWTLAGKPLPGTKMRFQTPPAHWNCRSTTVPITRTYSQIKGAKPQIEQLTTGQRAAMKGPVKKDMKYDDWFKSDALSNKERREILGPKRFELYRKNKLSMVDMVKTDGSPLTIKELELKFAA